MNPFLESGIVAAVTCFASLLVTFIFNKVAGIPKELPEYVKGSETKISSKLEGANKFLLLS